MVFNKRNYLIILTVIFIICSLFVPCLAVGEETGSLVCISYRGDTAEYPENSLEALLSAEEKGADMISVGVGKTSDGVYVLTEKKKLSNVTNAPTESISDITYDELISYNLYDNTGKLTAFKLTSLKDAVEKVKIPLILDIDWQEKDGIYELISEYNAFDRVIIRTKESAKTIREWVSSKEEKISVIGTYDGNIIFNAISHFDTLSSLGMPYIQFQSKNYFNIMYGSFFCQRFNEKENAPKAIAPMYDLDLSGQRSDSEKGWNEVIELGYSAIETYNIDAFSSYKKRCEEMKSDLAALTEKAKNADIWSSSQVTLKNRVDAITVAESVLYSEVSSLDEYESAYSTLLLAMNENNITAEEDTQKGRLNITAGKIIAAVLVGAVIFAAQIFVHKMQEEKSRK